MGEEAKICTSCELENGAGSSFCIRCGKGLTEATAGAGELEPHACPDVPGSDTEERMQQVVEKTGFETSRSQAGWRVVVPLAEDRLQKVYIMFNGRDDIGDEIVSMLSVCGPVKEHFATNLLRLNSTMSCGAFGVKTIQGNEYFVVSANVPVSSLDPDKTGTVLFEIARRADAVENQLSQGNDVY